MPKDAFEHIEMWVFDLDNTLYPPSSALFDQIHVRMTEFICRFLDVDPQDADALRAAYWRKHGTTLNGLMTEHDMPPEQFLEDVHDIDLSALAPATELKPRLRSCPAARLCTPTDHADMRIGCWIGSASPICSRPATRSKTRFSNRSPRRSPISA